MEQHIKWGLEHPWHNMTDPYYVLTRWEQVAVFRPETGHNRLSCHLHSKLHTEQCPRGTGSQTREHLLQSCPLCELFRKRIWSDYSPRKRTVALGTYEVLPPSSRRLEFSI